VETEIDVPTGSASGQTLLSELCQESEVIRLRAVRPQDGSLVLKWEDQLDDFYDDVCLSPYQAVPPHARGYMRGRTANPLSHPNGTP